MHTNTSITSLPMSKQHTQQNPVHSVEFFHIYCDEQIGRTHEAGLAYLQEMKKAWTLESNLIVLIDNYNPEVRSLEPDAVFKYLGSKDELPDYWAMEADLVPNAKILLGKITSKKIQKNYQKYVDNHGKYPCSLLTASWYLTRLGYLDSQNVIRQLNGKTFTPANRLINILPLEYESVETRALDLIGHTEFAFCQEYIQDLFFPVFSEREITVW